MRLLVVEDNRALAGSIGKLFRGKGYAVDAVETGEDARTALLTQPYDLVILDLGLPDVDGLEVLRGMRRGKSRVPVLVLTARASLQNRVEGLNVGADDYLVKPFALAELHARLRSLARRGQPERPAVLEVGDLRLDPARHEVRRAATEIDLSTKEFALLETLMRRPGEVLSRLELVEHAWDIAYETRSNIIDVYVRRLRDKIDRPFGEDSIETVRGAGYRLREEA